jgi:hypothetical protein
MQNDDYSELSKDTKMIETDIRAVSIKMPDGTLCPRPGYCWPELTFASGAGSTILAETKRLWRDFKPGSVPPLFRARETGSWVGVLS